MRGICLKKILYLVLLASLFSFMFFLFRPRPEPEQKFRANLTEAQKMLVTLRRAETAYQQSTQAYRPLSARKIGEKRIYTPGWNEMKLPNVEASTGFDYECLPAEGACQATETGRIGPGGNGIRIDIATGAYVCLGSYKPVTTEGFDGKLVTVACQAS